MKYLIGTKEYMTQIFTEKGDVQPVTAVKAGPVTVLARKTKEKDGYEAVQVGFGEKSLKQTSKAQKGHFKDYGNFAIVREYRDDKADFGEIKEGDALDVTVFEKGEKVRVTGTSKGKGFQGVVKRHGFHGGPRTHGQKHSEREAGSIGATGPQRVLKGVRMAGRMGGDTVTIKGLSIAAIDAEEGVLYVKGALPGRKGSIVEIRGVDS